MSLTHQQKVVIIVLSITIPVIIIGMFGIFFYFTLNTSPTARRKMLLFYSDDSSYTEVSVTLTNNDRLQTPPQNKQGQFYIGVEFNNPDDKNIFDIGSGFAFPATVYDVLIANGMDFSDGVKCKITASPRIWWDGGTPFAVAIKSADGRTTYLDYETGKASLLYYIENDMK